MPTPRRYANQAARQAAYRRRTAEQRQVAGTTLGVPPLPPVAPLPGYARWRALRRGAHLLLATIEAEMQQYYTERAETWQESERGETFLERLEALQEVQHAIDELWS
jgi:hypothetical protein